MKGVFIQKKNTPMLILLFLFGLFCIGVSLFAKEPITFVLMGVFISCITVPFLAMNTGAYLQIDENSIQGKYHWFGKINCKLSDVDFVLPQINTLTIELKNSKRHTIMGLANAWELCSFIRAHTAFEASTRPAELINTLTRLKKAGVKRLIAGCVCMVLMFANIFITVFLTGEREMNEFTQSDWTVFTLMAVLEIAIITILFYLANKTGKNNFIIEKMGYTIKRTVIETHPLSPGFVIAVYTDEAYQGRITVFGNPHTDAVWFSVDTLNENFDLIHQYTSDTLESLDEVLNQFDRLIDITPKFYNTTAE